MFLITNREVDERSDRPSALGKCPSAKGPNELRVVEATRKNGDWRVRVLPDECTPEMLVRVGLASKPGKHYASRYVAYRTFLDLAATRRRTKKTPAVVFFVHGFNNHVEAVLDRAEAFEKLYGVHVIAFTWPANGGGAGGVLSYRSDKRDALASVGALDRSIAKLHDYVQELNQAGVAAAEARAEAAHALDAERWDEKYAHELARHCPFTVNLVLHSMGNYLYKGFLGSSSYRGNLLVFDNVVLVAADTNHEGHAEWIDRIQCRRRVYVTINEDDVALRASRMKAGEEQKTRLGHCVHGLDSRRAVYVDFTRAKHVGDSHAYFEGAPVKRNPNVRSFFQRALGGEIAESTLDYEPARNLYVVR